MVDKEFAVKQINELALKYKSASVPERKLIKDQLCVFFFEIYKDSPTGFKEFNSSDRISEMSSLLYGADKKDGKCILDVFKDGNFYSYMNEAIRKKFLNILQGAKRTDLISDRLEECINDNSSDNPYSDNAIQVKSASRGMVSSGIEDDFERSEEVYAYLIILLNAEFEKHLPKKQNNPNRQLYNKLFFTEQFTEFCKHFYMEDEDNPGRVELLNKEALLFDTINIEFLDHVMEDLCRRISEVSDSEYKQNKCFDIKQNPEKRICPKFDAKVFITFLKKEFNRSVSNAVITQQRGNYRELMKKICN